MFKIWIDTGGTFTDGMAVSPAGELQRIKVLSSSCLRGRLTEEGRLVAPWLTHSIFDGYRLQILETGEEALVRRLTVDGILETEPAIHPTLPATVELFTGEEAPVLATRLLTQTPLSQSFPALELRLGTTRGTNALLERRGGRVALLVTRGFRDLLTIGTQQRPQLFQLAIPPADELATWTLEVDERVGADGAILEPLAEAGIDSLLDQLKVVQPDAVALSLLNAYRNPVHEQQLARRLREAGFAVSVGTELSASPHYLPRTQTTVVDAYLTPALRSYLTNLTNQLGEKATVRVMSSAGGLVLSRLFHPKDSLLSGPAGGVIGAASIAQQVSQPKVLTLDMGGTSTDVARYDGGVDYRFTTTIDGFTLQLPSLAVETVAAGGGSVCWFDGSQLRVGPQSAGASPGPACYGAGGPLTITDVNLLLGKLHAAQFNIPVFPEKAKEALRAILNQLPKQTGQTPEPLAILRGFERIADEAMAGAIRKISVSRGFDPREYALLAFGGAGGLHACSVARLLGMSKLILPFDGGLLSAYGMGQARMERMASQTVLRNLEGVLAEIPERIEQLAALATAELRRDIGPDAAIERRQTLLFLRFSGQESTVEVPMPATVELIKAAYRERYERLYGHFPENRPIELESIRVGVATPEPALERTQSNTPTRKLTAETRLGEAGIYDWTRLAEGNQLSGPAILLNRTSSAYLEPGWEATVSAEGNLVAQLSESRSGEPTGLAEVAETELFARRFTAIAEEMGAQLQRTAFSVNVKERLDFSCALLDQHAELLVNAPHIPVHLGSLGLCARLVLEQLPLAPGDVIVTNHPKYGGSHLPDVTLMSAVFTDQQELIGYVINRAHHAEIGGKVPGSMPPDATSLAEEGVVLEPQYIVRDGRLCWDELEPRFTQAEYPTRSLPENRADLEAALASLRAGELALQDLVRQYGLATVHHYMARIKASAAASLRARLTEPRVLEAEEKLDDGHQIRVRVVVDEHRRITFDFSGTSAVHPRNLNANRSILNSALLYVLRLWCEQEVPLNEGLLEPVTVILPETSFLNPVFSDDPRTCPAVVGGNTEVSQRLVDTLLKALNLAACSQGTMNNFLFGNAEFGYYETIGGGAGATEGAAGRSAVHQHMTNTKLTDPEELERRYPVRLRRFGIRSDSGGSGRWAGGDGIIRELEFLAPVQMTLVSQHRQEAPYGLNGGSPGHCGRQFWVRADGTEEALPGIVTRAVGPGERIRIETPGGGGWGVPTTAESPAP